MKSRPPRRFGDRKRVIFVVYVALHKRVQFPSWQQQHRVSQLRKFPPLLLHTRTSLYGNCRRCEIRNILQHFFALQTLVFNEPAVAVDGGPMKNMPGNIHANYGLVLFANFESLCSLVKLHS